MNEILTNLKAVKPNLRSPTVWVAVLALSICLVIVAAILLSKPSPKQNSNTYLSGTKAYRYSTLVNSNIQGTITSMEFSHPKEFTLFPKLGNIQKNVYMHTVKNSQGKTMTLGSIVGYATHLVIDGNPPVDLSAMRNSFNSDSSSYQTYAKTVSITGFLSNEVTAAYYPGVDNSKTLVDLGKPFIITTSYLNTDTWQFPFTAQNDTSPDQKVQGIIIFHLGKSTSIYNGYNYFMLSSQNNNWQPNQPVWHQIISSLKITDK